MPAHAKTERGLYTPDKIAIMRANLARYDGAKKTRDAAVQKGNRIVETPDDELAAWVHETGCPN